MILLGSLGGSDYRAVNWNEVLDMLCEKQFSNTTIGAKARNLKLDDFEYMLNDGLSLDDFYEQKSFPIRAYMCYGPLKCRIIEMAGNGETWKEYRSKSGALIEKSREVSGIVPDEISAFTVKNTLQSSVHLKDEFKKLVFKQNSYTYLSSRAFIDYNNANGLACTFWLSNYNGSERYWTIQNFPVGSTTGIRRSNVPGCGD